MSAVAQAISKVPSGARIALALVGRGASPEPIPALAPGLLALLSLLVAAVGVAGRAIQRRVGR